MCGICDFLYVVIISFSSRMTTSRDYAKKMILLEF